MELNLFYMLNILTMFAFAMTLGFRALRSPRTSRNQDTGLFQQEDTESWQGLALVWSIVSLILCLSCAVGAIDLEYTVHWIDAGQCSSCVIELTGTWMFSFVYLLLAVLPTSMIIALLPETWFNR